MNEKAEQQYADANKTRILVVDDHPLPRHGLVRLINEEPGFAVCAEAESTRRSLAILEKQKIDLAIVNISLDSSDSIRLAEEVRLQYRICFVGWM
jgi:DNA-binding NarL/FixJ family response regulator